MRSLGLGCVFRVLLRFFFRSFCRVMGCFFGCFRIRHDRPRLPTTRIVSDSSRFRSNNSSDVVISRNRLSSLFPSQEREDSPPPRNDWENFDVGSQRDDDQGLEDEAKFLKACGTLAGTPAEIRKASERLKLSPPSCGKDSEPSRFHSWLPNTSVEKLQLDVQPFKPPAPIKLPEEWNNSTDSLDHTPSSCISNAQNTQGDSLDSVEGIKTGSLHAADRTEKNVAPVSPWPATETQRKNKCVHFECDSDLSSRGKSFDSGGWHLKKTMSWNKTNACKQSPYPTPLKLFDEMQTPGTVYPTSLEDLPKGKPRVRSQYVYPIYKAGEYVSWRKIHEEEDFSPKQDSSELSDSVEQPQIANPTPEKGLQKISYENESKLGASLSSCLMSPASVSLEERDKRMDTAYSQIPHLGKTPADRPIIGMVAAHWNEDEDSHIPSPKWWDGNGIPNSTTKYKEDQKVNWHATPFEVRLEKALSEESFISQRKNVCGKPMAFDEVEESDTALSQLQSSTHPQSVVSF